MSHATLYEPADMPRVRPEIGSVAVTHRVSRLRDRAVPRITLVDRIKSNALTRVLIVTDDDQSLATLQQAFEADGREVLHARCVTGLMDRVAHAEIDLVITDQQLTDGDGLSLLAGMQRLHPGIMTALLSASGASGATKQAFGVGASDYLVKPVRSADALAFLRRADTMRDSRSAAATTVAVETLAMIEPTSFRGLLGTTQTMKACFRLIARVGRTDVTTLVTGESGTGKELVARALHDESSRRHKPFIALNCSALPSELVESELFGHMRGSFTGAVKDHTGLFEAANGGTLFLDEIGDLGPMAQAKVLRALESGEVMRVGGTKCTHVDVRVIAATNKPLDEMVAQGKFREDLLYRLKVIPIVLPPLRDRKDDIPLLASHFLRIFAERYGMPVREADADTKALLQAYDWPGNVRELRNVIEGALIMADGAMVSAQDLPAHLRGTNGAAIDYTAAMLEQSADLPFVEARERALREFDRMYLTAALAKNGGNIARTARALGLHRQSLQKLLARRELRASGEVVRDIESMKDVL